ncbi:hypothetical protein acsn021_43770 [Anaerocolumna cellulosilytica]|uniref:Uncharacterized protein n=1 Tax=Anaerocolumna cellulosilytica TaxID=433286 RepID=A0A6S6RDC8_9FIRM|nr:hypothetical protein acsn021_43770 [Anaerocolumna cellulosilytica]
MKENSIYFAENMFYQIIRDVGGAWNDSKERPIVCLLKLEEIVKFTGPFLWETGNIEMNWLKRESRAT